MTLAYDSTRYNRPDWDAIEGYLKSIAGMGIGSTVEAYDEIALGYSGTTLTTVTFKLASATVATLTLSYSGTTLTGVTKT